MRMTVDKYYNNRKFQKNILVIISFFNIVLFKIYAKNITLSNLF